MEPLAKMGTAFYGGQIYEDKRGEQALVITKEPNGERPALFINPMDSEGFINLTGVRAVQRPIIRVYIGLSVEAAKEMARTFSTQFDDPQLLSRLDRSAVYPHFLSQGQDLEPTRTLGPVSVGLRSTLHGYEIIEQ